MKNITKISAGVGLAFMLALSAGPAFALTFAPASPIYETTYFTPTCADPTDVLMAYKPSGGLGASMGDCATLAGTALGKNLIGNIIFVEFTSALVGSPTLANASIDPAYVATGAPYQVQADPSQQGLEQNLGGTFGYSLLTNVGTFLTSNIPLALVIGASLIGLGVLIHYVRKWIGRKA